MVQKAKKGRVGFDEYYTSVYGARWPELQEALMAPVRQVARINPFADPQQVAERSAGLPRAEMAGVEVVLLEGEKRLEPRPDKNGLFDFYVMDAASIFAAAALGAQEGENVLDLCAAPGGKSLILAEALRAGGQLTSNEISDRRRARLKAVLHDYLPSELRERVKVTAHDGARWCLHETEVFDKVLLDAPCSGERHLLDNPDEMKVWSQARSKNLAVRQYSLLASALAVARKGGRIVYSTCSISPLEDDAVIARLLKRRQGEARVLPIHFEMGEPTEHGWALLPDRTGFGPIYFSVLERVSN